MAKELLNSVNNVPLPYVGEQFMQVKHAYSHFKITLHPFFCRHLKGRIQKIGIMDYRWVTSSELSEYAFPRADQRVIAYLAKF